VRIGSPACVRKSLLQLPVSVNCFVVVRLQKEQIARRQQCLLQPETGGRRLAQIRQISQEAVLVIARTSHLPKVEQPGGIDLRVGSV
jgi:hypothetical protein